MTNPQKSYYIFSRIFFINILISIFIIIVGIYLALNFLDTYTKHNQYIDVPDFFKIKEENIDEFIADKKVRYEIINFLYDVELPKGVVVEQNPVPGTKVKENRKIYLTINSANAPIIFMPEIKDMTFRSAKNKLESEGLKVSNIFYKDNICVNCVIASYKDNDLIKTGDPLKKGTKINLVLGNGFNKTTTVPLLKGLSKKEAESLLIQNTLKVGDIHYDNTIVNLIDTISSFVYYYFPNSLNKLKIEKNTYIDLYFTIDKNKID